MNSIDRIAQKRGVLFGVVLGEFQVWFDKQRQSITPNNMEMCIAMWQEEVKK